MAFSLNDFKSNMADGGARPSLFEVQLTWPTGISSSAVSGQSVFFVRAATIPAATVGVISVPYQGRKLKYAGDRTYEDITLTILNDEGFKIRKALEDWTNAITGLGDNLQSRLIGQPGFFTSDVHMTQYKRNGDVAIAYRLKDAWPQNIGTISLDWDTNDQIETYDVTISYQWFEQTR